MTKKLHFPDGIGHPETSTYKVDERPEAVVMNPDPIDIIVTGYDLAGALYIGATSWDAQPCMFVDCSEDVYYSPQQFDAATDVYFLRADRNIHDDDSIFVCCRSHVDAISNSPAIVGTDIFAARNALAAAL